MDPIYVCGHRNPDTDSVVSAMAFAALHNALGDNAYVAAMQGAPNDETQFLLDRFGFQAPTLLTNVRTQVRDIDYDRPPTLGTSVPISHAWAVLREDENLSAVPVTNEDGTLYGMLTAGGIAEKDMESITKPEVRDVPIFNLLSALEGHIINNEEDTFDTISGEVVIALPTPGECLKGVNSGSIVICGQQKDVVDKALEIGASCVIICQGSLSEKYLGLSSKTCIIATPCDAYRAARMIYQAIPVQRIAQHTGVVLFHLNDFIDDVRETVLQSRYRSYPVLDENEKVVGTLSRYHLLRRGASALCWLITTRRASPSPVWNRRILSRLSTITGWRIFRRARRCSCAMSPLARQRRLSRRCSKNAACSPLRRWQG